MRKISTNNTSSNYNATSSGWKYSSFFDVGNRVVYMPRGIHCIVIEKYFRTYKLQHSQYSSVTFMADEEDLRLYMPIDPPDYFNEL